MRLTDGIVKALDRIGSGRAALAVLLDHRDPGVRALAGVYLIDLLPERVSPILRQVEEEGVAAVPVQGSSGTSRLAARREITV